MNNTKSYDVIIIGGGINGIGVAQAAAAQGFSTLLLEKTTLAAGTSQWSSKLIHGGLRYLEGGHFSLVRESLRERTILQRIAPQLVQLIPFHIPIYNTSQRKAWYVKTGLALYAVLGGLKKKNRFNSLSSSTWSSLDGLNTTQLDAVLRYWDGQTDDAALTQAVARSAKKLGAHILYPAQFMHATQNQKGFLISYTADDQSHQCRCKVLVNAAGPWIGNILNHIQPAPPVLPYSLVQGTHILIDSRLTQGAYYLEHPDDQRAIFLIPWKNQTLVGTTETEHHGLPEKAEATTTEIDYLQRAVQYYFPKKNTDVCGHFAGLRVLPENNKRFSSRSREVVLTEHCIGESQLISIYGGKLTTYRATAEKVLHKMMRTLGRPKRYTDTRNISLPIDVE